MSFPSAYSLIGTKISFDSVRLLPLSAGTGRLEPPGFVPNGPLLEAYPKKLPLYAFVDSMKNKSTFEAAIVFSPLTKSVALTVTFDKAPSFDTINNWR